MQRLSLPPRPHDSMAADKTLFHRRNKDENADCAVNAFFFHRQNKAPGPAG